jgi:hypothetical protein
LTFAPQNYNSPKKLLSAAEALEVEVTFLIYSPYKEYIKCLSNLGTELKTDI